MPSSSSNATVVTGGGPTLVRSINEEHQLTDGPCKDDDRETIFQKMQETFECRQRLIHNLESSAAVLSVFPRLLDTKGLVN